MASSKAWVWDIKKLQNKAAGAQRSESKLRVAN